MDLNIYRNNVLHAGDIVCKNNTVKSTNDSSECPEKHSAVWTSNATLSLLQLYESKLEMLETPKKKTRIWQAISDSLMNYNIDMTPDQIRWKINALTKKYKQCLESGQHDKFKYFKEIDNIYAQFNVDCDSCPGTELQQENKDLFKTTMNGTSRRFGSESKAMIELRKIRLARRIESDRTQGKILLERQWLEYLKQQEQQNAWKEEVIQQDLRLKEEQLALRRRKLELYESLADKTILLLEKQRDSMLEIKKEKCELLKKYMN